MLGPRRDVVLDPWPGAAIPVGYRAAAGAASELDHLDLVRHAGDAAVPCGLLEGCVALVLAADASADPDPAFIDLHLDVFVRNLSVPDHALQDLAPKFVIGPSSGAEQVHLELVVDLVDTVG